MVKEVNGGYEVLPHHHYCWYEDNYMCFVEVSTGDIYLLESATEGNVLSYLVTVPNYIYKQYKYRICICYKNKIYLFPEDGDKILIYNAEDEKWKYIEVGNIKTPTNPHIYNGTIILFVYKNREIYLFNLDIYTHQYEFLSLNFCDGDRIINEMVINGDVIYSASAKRDRIYLYNRVCQSTEIISVANLHKGWSTICVVHDDLWLSNWDGEIYKYNIISRKKIKYEVKNNILPRIMKEAPVFFDCIYVGGALYFIPGKAEEFICINPETMKNYKLKVNDIIGMSKQFIYTRYWVEYTGKERYVYVYDVSEQKIWKIDTMLKDISIRKYIIDSKSLKRKKSMPLYESIKFDRHFYEMCFKQDSEDNVFLGKTSIGDQIYKTICL